MKKSLFLVILYSISLTFFGCDTEAGKWLEDYRKKQMIKRYGEKAVSKEQIEDWQKEIKEYEEIVQKKIDAGQKTSRLYRLIGESFAKMESYQLCAENLEKALDYGYTTPRVYYWLGVCYGNLAKTNAWDYDTAIKAEKNFLKALTPQENSKIEIKAKFQLSLLYFYAFGSNHPYRVNSEYITVTQKDFRNKAIKIMKEYQFEDPGNFKSYFALAGMYKIIGNIPSAISQMEALMRFMEKNYPKRYKKFSEYQKASQNLSLLSGIKH